MVDRTALTLDLFDGETDPKPGDSLQVEAVRALIAEIRENGTMTAAKQVMCATAMRLAHIIEQPKSAIAAVQAAAQLTPLIEKLTAEEGNAAGFTPEMKALIDALAVDPASYAQPPAGDPSEPGTPDPATP
ncbi:hypothetical protein [Leucobacter triazinivorans]|uniref:Terminase small subunit n=1 Tax=Leucobacter triazinivorans TaxID=1784719 RepID=A0A4P6KED1_9MICO|nr:hypothetical protein [Leucobacter triazinivorans]QBE48756.1 hypothetical protein EVS81_07855 [Leucobacter triazinivorans]